MQFLCEDKDSRLLKIKHIVIFITIIEFAACKPDASTLVQISSSQVSIDSSISKANEIEQFVNPYTNRINTVLDSTLAYAPKIVTKDDGQYNTSAGNLMADLLLEQSSPIFKARTGNDVDFVLFNHGGIRSIISKGNVSARTAYEIMPFENEITVVELNGLSVLELAEFVVKSGRAHPVAGIQIVIDKNERVKELKIRGMPFNKNKNYFVATSSYLVTGGDNMVFFKDGLSFTNIDYFIRNAIIDYFNNKDTIVAEVDNRIVRIN